MKIQLMNIKRQHEKHAELYEQAALEVLRSGGYIGGAEVSAFESEFAQYMGAKYAVSTGNGTDALVIALRSLGIGEGDEVITVAFTFFATAEAIAAVGAKPVFIDVCEDTYCMDPTKIEAAITDKTKAILPVHIYGHCADMDAICQIAKKHGLKVVEDCCQAAGSFYKGKPAGTLGDVGCFSFFPTKNLGCAGDGGIIITNDEYTATAAAAYKVHGSGSNGLKVFIHENGEPDKSIAIGEDKYHNYVVGYNSRLDAIQAAILRKKLPLLKSFIEGRRDNAKNYNDALKDSGYKTPYESSDCLHSYYIYALKHNDAGRIVKSLNERGIGCGVYYPVPLHKQGAFYKHGSMNTSLPVTEELCRTTFAIPVYPELTVEERNEVIKALLEEDKK